MIIKENGKYVVCTQDGKRIGMHNEMGSAMKQEMKSNHSANMPKPRPEAESPTPKESDMGKMGGKGGMGGMAM